TGFLEIHLDDQTDSKSLFGSYICTDVPGEFTWQPGVLTQAVTSGKWVLIEDLDRCPAEVLASLLPLLEGNRLPSPRSPGGYLAAAPGPALRSAGGRWAPGSALAVLNYQALWRAVGVAPLRPAEAREVARRRHPGLPPRAVDGLLTMFRLAAGAGARGRSGRPASVRDFFKLCARLDGAQQEEEAKTEEVSSSSHLNFSRDDDDREDRARSVTEKSDYLTEKQRLHIIQEGIDVFVSLCPNPKDVAEMVAAFSSIWEIDPEIAISIIMKEQVNISMNESAMIIGRTTLPRIGKPDPTRKGGFAMTAHATRLLSSVAAASIRSEPLLLVGETGCGKTTLVQEIASGLGVKLVVQNMSLQTDSTDLLGGYRPVEVARWGCCQ
ncbi:unnamed protein product, partial [Heterosigma akashiwo]